MTEQTNATNNLAAAFRGNTQPIMPRRRPMQQAAGAAYLATGSAVPDVEGAVTFMQEEAQAEAAANVVYDEVAVTEEELNYQGAQM
jgi:hypothetical protein